MNCFVREVRCFSCWQIYWNVFRRRCDSKQITITVDPDPRSIHLSPVAHTPQRLLIDSAYTLTLQNITQFSLDRINKHFLWFFFFCLLCLFPSFWLFLLCCSFCPSSDPVSVFWYYSTCSLERFALSFH